MMTSLSIEVLGSHPILFTTGSLTGYMHKDKRFGIGIATVMYPDGKLLGGAITYEDSVALRDYLIRAIDELDTINATYDWSEE